MFNKTGIFQAGLIAVRRPWRAPGLVAAGGGLVCLLGATYLAGWVLQIPALIRGQPGLDTIPPSGALGFLLLGAGLTAAALGGRRWGVLCGGSAALLGGATLLEHLFGGSSVVDSLLFQLFRVETLSAPGGMPPGGATAFLVAGVGTVCAAGPLPERWRFLVLATEGAVVAAIGVLARTGFVSQLGGPEGGSLVQGLPLQAAFGFVLVGAGIVGLGIAGPDAGHRLHKALNSDRLESSVAGGPATPALLILGIGLLLASIAVVLLSLRQTQLADAEVRHTLNVIIALDRIEKALADKEAGYRGFVITGQERFLEPYHAGLKNFAEGYGEARQLTVDNPEQQRRLEAVHSLNERLDEYAGNLIELRRGVAGESRARLTVATGIGKSLIESLRVEMDRAKSLEVRLLSERKGREVATRTVMTAALLFCVVGGVLTSTTQFLLARRLETQRLALVSEIALREAAELRFRTILDQAPQPIIVSDGEGRILEVNSETVAEFGYGREELIGQSGAMLVPARDQVARAERRKEILGEFKARSLGPDLVCVRKDGSEFPAVARLCPIQTPDGPQFITSLVNVSERKRIEDELLRANQAFEAANKELEAFAYSVSHDLRAPLRGMTGFSQILIEDFGSQLPPQAQEYLGRIQRAGTRMGQLIDDMLTLSRISRGELGHESVNLSALAADVLDDLRKTEPERKVECAVADGLKVTGDARLLRILLDNILGNAWKFTGHAAIPCIEFATTSTDGGQAFYVRDNGAGFDMAYADKLFGAFQRLHTSDEFPGTGIGLAIAQRIVNRHGGRIWAEGSVGNGATFYFTV